MATLRRNGGKWITQTERQSIHQRDNWTCVYCGTMDDLTLDHVVCDSHGGSDAHNNLVTACRSCNSRRGNQLIEDFATYNQLAQILNLVTLDMTVYREQVQAERKLHKGSTKYRMSCEALKSRAKRG